MRNTSLFDLIGGIALFFICILALVQAIRHFNEIPVVACIFFAISIAQGFCCYWNWKPIIVGCYQDWKEAMQK